MAFLTIPNVSLRGISACVPKTVVDNKDSSLFTNSSELDNYISNTGVRYRHVADSETCSSDLCFQACNNLLDDLSWSAEEIDCLIFLSQTPDYIYPATSNVLQKRLGFSTNCICFDISMGCPGWVYGLSVISSLMSSGSIKKGLLLVGETVSKTRSPYDRVNLISGDAGTATALEYDSSADPLYFDLHSDGSGYQTIIINGGGYRHPFDLSSLQYHEDEDGILRNSLQTHMDGAGVFAFAISVAPKSINSLIDHFNINRDEIDFYLLHQANQFINRKIMKKLKIDEQHCPSNLFEYGNTSSTSIPLMITCKMQNSLSNTKVICCGFGVGLSWGSVSLSIGNNFHVSKLTEI